MECERDDVFIPDVDRSNAIMEKRGCTSFPLLVTGLFLVSLPVHPLLSSSDSPYRQGGPDTPIFVEPLEGIRRMLWLHACQNNHFDQRCQPIIELPAHQHNVISFNPHSPGSRI